MTVEKLSRVMQRARSMIPHGQTNIGLTKFRKCIMIECGTARATYFNNMDALKRLGWIYCRKKTVVFTGKDVTEDFL